MRGALRGRRDDWAGRRYRGHALDRLAIQYQKALPSALQVVNNDCVVHRIQQETLRWEPQERMPRSAIEAYDGITNHAGRSASHKLIALFAGWNTR